MKSLPRLLALALAACTTGGPVPGASVLPDIAQVYVAGAAEGSLTERARMLSSATRARVVPRPGRRGAEALAELVGHDEDPTLVAVVGPAVMTAGLVEGASPRVESNIPVARLASEALVIAVARNSPIADAGSLRHRLERDASSVRFAGSDVGGVEHQLAALLVKEAAGGVRPLVFAAYGSTREAAGGVSGGQSDVLVARYGEARPLLPAGLRALAVTSAARLPGVDLPTLRESKIDVVLVDWALLVAPPRVAGGDVAALRDLARRAHASSAWNESIAKSAFVDDFSTEAMTTFVGVELSRATTLLRELALIR